ncbi:MAG: acetate--CoA ligase family protein, partial [Planctomycetota bacterium]
MAVAAGGVTAELFKDTAYRLAPVDAAGAMAMLKELRTFPMLDGYRGAPKADIDALVRIICEVSQLAAVFQDTVREIELNPVLV